MTTTIHRLLALPALVALLLSGCTPERPADDDTGIADDDDFGDDDTFGDDDDVAPDICDGHPNEILCDGETEVVCDVAGDIASTEDCDTAHDIHCWPGLGCVMCYPGTRDCDGSDVVECAGDGLGWELVETCSEADGFMCEGGMCISLCDQAEQLRSSMGCAYYGVDMQQFADDQWLQYAIVVSNVHETLQAEVQVATKSGGVWSVYASASVDPLDLHIFELPDVGVLGTAVTPGQAYKVTSQIPVIAYQFNPLEGEACSSDASLMLPTSAYDTAYYVPGWGSSSGTSEINVVAEVDGTEVFFTPTVNTASGGGLPTVMAGTTHGPVILNEGDVLQVAAGGNGTSYNLAGTYVGTSERVGVYAGNTCANVPDGLAYCDHVEEQVFGLQTWGTETVCGRLPPRDNPPEDAVWRFLAGDAATTLTFQADAGISGMPPGNTLNLGPGESTTITVTGTATNPGDFLVTGTEAFLATQYMIGGNGGSDDGDPCMILTVPTEQFRDTYVVLVPTTWVNDRMTLIREPGAQILVNGSDVASWPGVTTTPILGLYEAVRIDVPDGVYLLEGTAPFSVAVVGYDYADSYCYPGGLNQEIINDL